MPHFQPVISDIIYEHTHAKTGIVKNHVPKIPVAKSAYDRSQAIGRSAFAASCTVCMLWIPQLKSIVPAVSIMKNIAKLEKIIPVAFPFFIKRTLFFNEGSLCLFLIFSAFCIFAHSSSIDASRTKRYGEIVVPSIATSMAMNSLFNSICGVNAASKILNRSCCTKNGMKKYTPSVSANHFITDSKLLNGKRIIA